MTDTDPHASLWAKLARHHTPRTLQWRIVHYGFWSSIIFLALMVLDVFAPGLFRSHYMAIAVVYMIFQLAEVLSRDALNWAEVLEGCGFALAPAIFCLVALTIDWHSNYTLFTLVGREVMAVWFWFAWIMFAFGVGMSMKILSTPFRRSESPAPKS